MGCHCLLQEVFPTQDLPGSSQPRDRTQVSHTAGRLYCLSQQGLHWVGELGTYFMFLNQGLAGYAGCALGAKSGPLPVLINKVLLTHSHTLVYMLSRVVLMLQELSGFGRDHMARKA